MPLDVSNAPLLSDGPLDGSFATIGHGRLKAPIKLWHRIHGTGPIQLVFVMGLNITHQSWDHQYDYFGKLDQYSCLVFDNRGVGHSDAPSGMYSTSEMARDTVELLDSVGWTRPVHVVGVSMGGMISMEMASLFPARVASLTLTSTHAGDLLVPLPAVVAVPRLMVTTDPVQKMEGLIRLLFPPAWLELEANGVTNREVMREVFVRRGKTVPVQTPMGAIGQLFAAISHHVSPARLKAIADSQIPVMVVTGTWDNLVRPANSYYLVRHLKPRVFRVFEGAGHAVATEYYQEYNALLKEFVEGVAVGGREQSRL
ncbi:hypothetical protein HDU98_003804 [Podochytrium sp. JEL0797]|nr:hypothetical protein HDU98_003804 [Podochytrium sp. JEL0797]